MIAVLIGVGLLISWMKQTLFAYRPEDFLRSSISQSIKVSGQDYWTLFDTGERNSYVIPSVAQLLQISTMTRSFDVALRGKVKQTNVSVLLDAEVEGHPISTHALVVDSLGRDNIGKPIEILFGALAMKQWGIKPLPNEERLDLSRYPDQFVEF
jgi:hypothetical protein